MKNFTAFDNPAAYFRMTDGLIYSWDMNCDDPQYSNCRFDYSKQANYCA
jgi:hypothetical protein